MKALLVEDDPELASVLESGLSENQIDVTAASDYKSGLREAALRIFDVVILDVMLPGGTGFELCRELRSRKIATPILMLTARDALDDRVTGLDVGADDYLVKPFAFRELLARLRALSRRLPALAPKIVKIADLTVDLETHGVTRGERAVPLTAKEFSLLEFFVLNQNKVVDRAAITAHVWDENHDPFTNVLEVLVRRLRRKIDDEFDPKLIHTLRGAGYRFGISQQ